MHKTPSVSGGERHGQWVSRVASGTANGCLGWRAAQPMGDSGGERHGQWVSRVASGTANGCLGWRATQPMGVSGGERHSQWVSLWWRAARPMGVSGGERHSQWVSRVASGMANGCLGWRAARPMGLLLVLLWYSQIPLAILVGPYKEGILWFEIV